MRAFDFVNASSLQEAADAARSEAGRGQGDRRRHRRLRHDQGRDPPSYPEVLVDLKTVPGLDYIAGDGDGALAIGSLTTLARPRDRSADPRDASRPLAEAAHAVASPQLRNMGTIAGNLCQEPRCWYYRAPDDYFDCIAQGRRQLQRPHRREPLPLHLRSATIARQAVHRACPAAVDIPVYMEKLRTGDVAGAARHPPGEATPCRP